VTWGEDDLSLEKLKIHSRLEALEGFIKQDKEETTEFRGELKSFMREQREAILGDGKNIKGLHTRVTELETVRSIHSKAMWGIAIPAMALITKQVWDFLTGSKHG